MKKVLVAFFFAMISLNLANAQSALSASQQTTVEPKLMLSSRINEFSANFSRGRTDVAQKLFPDVMALMSERISALHNEVKTATGEQKEALTKKLDVQQKIYSDVKMLSGDVAKNGKELDGYFKKFVENY